MRGNTGRQALRGAHDDVAGTIIGVCGGGSGMFELTDQGKVLVGTSLGILGGLVGLTIGGLRGGLTEYLCKENSMPQSDDPSPTN